mgnify:CR=1 FL=1
MARRRARNARPRRLPLAIGLTLILAGLITVAANAAEGYGLFDRLIAGAALTTARDKAARALRESWPGVALITAGGAIVLLGRARRGR